ncbi:MAG: pyridoxamine 5'-phosphate oxidase family protein [Candidatus Dormiibacterota bacterium]
MAISELQALLDSSWAKAGRSARAAWSQPDRMTAEQVTRFVCRQRNCALATTSPQGEPHLVPVSFLFLADGSFWLPAVAGAARLRDIRSRPRAALLVGQGQGAEHHLVIASGPIEVVASGDLPRSVLVGSADKLGNTSWASWWLVLRPDRLIAYGGEPAN